MFYGILMYLICLVKNGWHLMFSLKWSTLTFHHARSFSQCENVCLVKSHWRSITETKIYFKNPYETAANVLLVCLL